MPKPNKGAFKGKKKDLHAALVDRLNKSLENGFDDWDEGLTFEQIHKQIQYVYSLVMVEEANERMVVK